MDISLAGLRVLREIAELGSFTAAASSLGYTQPAVSRQVAVLEREAGVVLFQRRPGGARLTADGSSLLGHARVVLDELDRASRDLSGADARPPAVRLGVYVSAGAGLLPGVLGRLRREALQINLTSREGTSPALVRSVRAGTLELAVITSRPPYRAPDSELPRLHVETLSETSLVVAVPAAGRFAGRESVGVDELADVEWVASPGTGAEPLLGVWPGLEERARIAHVARDWLTKLTLVANGFGITTVPTNLVPLLPDGVRVVRVVGGPPEWRRMLLVRLPGPVPDAVALVARAVQAAR